MQAFKIIISYDGTDFHGWQMQSKDESITSCLQKTFKNVFGQSISLLGASRTDSGVHALGQVAKFKANIDIDEQIILKAWNASLPKSILIRQIEKISNNFHPQRNVLQKTYYYNLFLKQPLPFIARYGWLYGFIHKVDFEKFNSALQVYVGEHDFGSFCKIEEEGISSVRTIDSININTLSKFGALQVVVKGKSFLRFQIRRMIGYALDVARRPELNVDYLKNILKNPNPQQNLVKADACGLCLRKIIYKNEKHT